MSNTDRVMIFPSRANHMIMKHRIVAANKGLNLLKRKRDALELKLKEILAELDQKKLQLNKTMQESLFSLAKARYMGTDFNPVTVIKPERADVYLRIKTGKVVGVSLPKFALVIRPTSCFPMTGLSRGGEQVEKVREKFQETLKLLISLASLKYSSVVLMEASRQNNMRINGLDYVLIPRFIRTVMYIREELDEFEREDFYRLKRSQAKQRKAKEKFSALIKKLNAPVDEFLIPIPENVEEIFDDENFVEKNKDILYNEEIPQNLKRTEEEETNEESSANLGRIEQVETNEESPENLGRTEVEETNEASPENLGRTEVEESKDNLETIAKNVGTVAETEPQPATVTEPQEENIDGLEANNDADTDTQERVEKTQPPPPQ